MGEVEELLEKAIKKYNKYKQSQANAELLEFDEDNFTVEFEGDLDTSSAMDEHFMALLNELAEEGLKSELIDFRPKKRGEFIAKYKIRE